MPVIIWRHEIYIRGVRPDFTSLHLLYLHHRLSNISAQWLLFSIFFESLLVGEFKVPVFSLWTESHSRRRCTTSAENFLTYSQKEKQHLKDLLYESAPNNPHKMIFIHKVVISGSFLDAFQTGSTLSCLIQPKILVHRFKWHHQCSVTAWAPKQTDPLQVVELNLH